MKFYIFPLGFFTKIALSDSLFPITITHPELNFGSAIQNHGHLFNHPGEVFDPDQPHWTLSHASQFKHFPIEPPIASSFNYTASQHLAWFYSPQKYRKINFNGTFFHHTHLHFITLQKGFNQKQHEGSSEQDLGLAFTLQYSLFKETLRLGLTPHFIHLFSSTLKSKKSQFNLNFGATYQFAQIKQFQFYANFIIRNALGHFYVPTSYSHVLHPTVFIFYYPRNYELSVSLKSPLWSNLKNLGLELGKRFHETFDFYGRKQPLSPFFFKGSFRCEAFALQLGWTSEFLFGGIGLHFRHFQLNFLSSLSNILAGNGGSEISLAVHF